MVARPIGFGVALLLRAERDRIRVRHEDRQRWNVLEGVAAFRVGHTAEISDRRAAERLLIVRGVSA